MRLVVHQRPGPSGYSSGKDWLSPRELPATADAFHTRWLVCAGHDVTSANCPSGVGLHRLCSYLAILIIPFRHTLAEGIIIVARHDPLRSCVSELGRVEGKESFYIERALQPDECPLSLRISWELSVIP
jgi:hypothetical protein